MYFIAYYKRGEHLTLLAAHHKEGGQGSIISAISLQQGRHFIQHYHHVQNITL